MTTVSVIRELFEETYPIFHGIVADLSLDELKKTHDNATIGSILNVYTHTIAAEDWMVQELIEGGKKVWETGGWADRIGLPEKDGFFQESDLAKIDQATWQAFQAYGAAVQKATTDYIASATDADLARGLELYGKPRNVAYVLANYAFFHLLQHAGEMAALKGLMGKQGMPY